MALEDRTFSFGTCEREFEKIQKALQGISDDIDEKLSEPEKQQRHPSTAKEDGAPSDANEDLTELLKCDEQTFEAKISKMKSVDLDLAVIVFEQQIKMEQEIARDDSESKKKTLAEMRERLTRCFIRKAELARSDSRPFQGDKYLSNNGSRNASSTSSFQSDSNEAAGAVQNIESLNLHELKSLLYYNGINYNEKDSKETLVELVITCVLDNDDGDSDDWEPPGDEEMNWTSPTIATETENPGSLGGVETEKETSIPADKDPDIPRGELSEQANDKYIDEKINEAVRPISGNEPQVVKETSSTISDSETRHASSNQGSETMASKKATIQERMDSIDSEDEDLPHLKLEEGTVLDWDPRCLLRDLHFIMQREEAINFNKKEAKQAAPKDKDKCKLDGYLEKLPVNQTKATLLKGWKKRYFKISHGKIHYFENHLSTVSLGSISLTGSELKVPGDKMIQIKSQNSGDTLTIRCSSSNESNDWYRALKQQSAISIPLTVPVKVPLQLENPTSHIIIIDLGASTIKGGFAGEEKPRVIFPAVYAVNKERKDGRRFTESGVPDPALCTCGYDAFDPEIRRKSKLIFPLRPTLKVDKFSVKSRYIPGFIDKVMNELNVDPSNYTVILSCQRHFSERDKEILLDHLFGHLGVSAVYAQQQALLSLYAYKDTTGVIVDIGDHIDVFPVLEGVIIENGSSSLPQGGQLVTEHLSRLLSEGGYRFFSEVESCIVKYVKEKSAFVSLDYQRDLESDPKRLNIDVSKYSLPGKQSSIEIDTERFRCAEGLFDPNAWGKDHEGIHKLVEKAIKQSGIDQRREMCRKVFLSGGTTLIEGFAERLQKELKFLMPETVNIQVHGIENRANAAFMGASVLSDQPTFSQILATKEDWHAFGSEILKRMSQS